VVAVAMDGTYLSKVNHPISILMELESMQTTTFSSKRWDESH
jgi:hypothetical protein